jgi:hypothetical protein
MMLLLVPAVGLPRCLCTSQSVGTPPWQLNQTLIPGNALRYYYVNPVGLCATQRKSGIWERCGTAGKIGRSANLASLLEQESRASAPRPLPGARRRPDERLSGM